MIAIQLDVPPGEITYFQARAPLCDRLCAGGENKGRSLERDPGGFLSPFDTLPSGNCNCSGQLENFGRPGSLPAGSNGQIRVECLNCLRRRRLVKTAVE